MTLLAVAVALSLAASAWAVYPIFARRVAVLRDPASSETLDAEAARRVALASLQEVEYDYIAGKLDDADYRLLRERIGREALAALHAVDGVAGGPARHACGFANRPGSRFCAGCGARIG